MKIAILDYSGSGKSTLARQLGDYYKAPAPFLDTVQFLPNWVERDLRIEPVLYTIKKSPCFQSAVPILL